MSALPAQRNPMHRLRTLRVLVVFLTLLTARAALAQDLVTLVKRIQPAVVTLTVYDSANNPLRSGSGFFINQGLLVSNRHVLAGASRAEGRTPEGKTYAVSVVVADDKDGDL